MAGPTSRRVAFAAMITACAGTSLAVARCGRPAGETTRRPPPPPKVETASATAVGPPTVTVRIRTDQAIRRISPLIYGVAVASAEDLAALRPRLHRWGGNPNSRYNWELGSAWNAARDWEFRNYGKDRPSYSSPSSSADEFVTTSRAAGAEPVLSIPALGWVARDGNNASLSVDVPRVDGRPVQGYDPAANRRTTSVRSVARKGSPPADPPDLTDDVVYQDEWIHHLLRRHGPSSLRHVVIDNEPDLWDITHTDVHPDRLGYDDMLRIFLEYATAVKDAAPSAQVWGPALSGWTALHYSSRDRGTDNFRAHADRKAHGDVPLLPWWLDQVKRHDERVGRRTLDVLDVHYYPQAPNVFEGGGATDSATNALRLRATKSLWDPTYSDESWIREPVRLIPRLREWIDRHYPGTLLAIGEWNWGGERTMNGALAVADVLGIMGREGVDLAAYWTAPPRDSLAAHAFKLFTNFDEQGGTFGGQALSVGSVVPVDELSLFAAHDSGRRELLAMALNKQPGRRTSLTMDLEGMTATRVAGVRLSDTAPGPTALTDVSLVGQQVAVDLPPSSITLLRMNY